MRQQLRPVWAQASTSKTIGAMGQFQNYIVEHRRQKTGAVPGRTGILNTVPNKPFATTYRLRLPGGGLTIINGEQVTRIMATKVPDREDSWEVTFYLTDGHEEKIPVNSWTRNFVHEIFLDDGPEK